MKNKNVHKLLASSVTFVLVLGITIPAYAGNGLPLIDMAQVQDNGNIIDLIIWALFPIPDPAISASGYGVITGTNGGNPALLVTTSHSGVCDSETQTLVTSSVLVLPPGCPDIDYVFTGTGTGNLGTSNFANADFIVTVWGNTCNVMEILRPDTFTNRALMAKVEVVGVGTAMVTEETGVFSNIDPQIDAVGWSEFTGDNLNVDINNLRPVGVTAANYKLTTNFGPVFDPSPFGFQVTVSTDAGIFDVQNISDGSFTARLKQAIGGEISPTTTSALLLAGSQNMMAWMIPLVIAAAGFGLVISRKL